MTLTFDQSRPLDVIAMGRATIDLYANEMGPLEDAVTFTKFVGGSPANTSVAMSNMGLAVGYIGKVSDDQFGRYIVRYLKEKGVDVSHIAVAGPGVRSGVTMGEIVSPTECSFFTYRNDVADLHIRCTEIDESYIRQAKALLISGTSLSHSPAREAVFLAMEYARRNGTRIIFDPDYREWTWHSEEETAVYYRLAMERADIVIGTREEFNQAEKLLMPGNDDDARTAAALHERGVSLVGVKRGKSGSTIFTSDGAAYRGKVYPVDVYNTFGAGDAYAGAFLYAVIRGAGMEAALCYGAASASITVSGQGCSSATPTRAEVEAFLARREPEWAGLGGKF